MWMWANGSEWWLECEEDGAYPCRLFLPLGDGLSFSLASFHAPSKKQDLGRG